MLRRKDKRKGTIYLDSRKHARTETAATSTQAKGPLTTCSWTSGGRSMTRASTFGHLPHSLTCSLEAGRLSPRRREMVRQVGSTGRANSTKRDAGPRS